MRNLTATHILSSLGNVGSTILVIAAGVIVLEAILYLVFNKWLHNKYALPIMLISPAALGLILLIVYPLVWELGLAFSNMNLRTFRNPTYGFTQGFQNLKNLFTEPVLKQQYFVPVLLRTFLWTFIQVSCHVSLGMCLALLLNRKIKLKGLYRTLLVFPWAVPQIIAILAWNGEFHAQYGFINILLQDLGLAPVEWKSDPTANFIAFNIVNIWLGVPFMMVTLLGGLQSISKDYYEAADIDGASGLSKFRHVTMPLLQPVLTPVVVLGIIWTFNNFNVPFLMNDQELETSDILVTALFRSAFQYNRYGFAAAFAFIIFIVLLGFTVVYMKVSNYRPVVSNRKRVLAREA
jgi:arabinogalactan oligomer/maltooligosaccharide transport system permease protein